MSPLDTTLFDWFGDSLVPILIFNFALVGPASFATGHGVAASRAISRASPLVVRDPMGSSPT